jgi:virginiamycin B lyase
VSPDLEALESRRLLASITEMMVPSGGKAGPDGLVAGPGGTLWFADYNSDKIGVVSANTHKMTEYQLPTNNAQPLGITLGPDGNIWFTESGVGQIGVFNVANQTITEYSLSSPYAIPYAITSGGPGSNTVWFTEEGNNDIGMIDVTSGKVSEFSIPTPDSVPEGITLGPGGAIWFTESIGNQIGVIDPTSHAISEYGGLSAGSQPDAITAGSGNLLWFTEYTGNNVGMINATTHAVSEFAIPTANSRPDGIVAANGALWFTEYAGNKIGTIDPGSDHISEMTVPSAGSLPVGIAGGPKKSIWFTELNAGNLGVIGPSLHLTVTKWPTQSVEAGSAFDMSVAVEDDSNTIDTDYNGPVTVSLGSSAGGGTLGGTLTAMAKDGVATFPGLTLSAAGNYTLQVSTSGATAAMVTLPTITQAVGVPPVIIPPGSRPPQIISEQILTTGKGRHKTTIGFRLVFNSPLDAAAAQNAANYGLTQTMKRGREKAVRAVRLRAIYDPSTESVRLLLSGKPRFAAGGRLVVNAASPAGIMGAAGAYLNSNGMGTPGYNAVFLIGPNMRSISG